MPIRTSPAIYRAVRLWDADGNGELNDNDRVVLGDPYPDFTWGMTNNFRIGNFDVSFLLQGVQGVTVFNGDVFYTESHKYNRAYMEDRWVSPTHPGDGKTPYAKNGYDIMLTDLGPQDASYLCLRNLTVGYTLPKKAATKLGLRGLRFYVTGTNLLYLWSDEYKGINPESRMTTGTTPARSSTATSAAVSRSRRPSRSASILTSNTPERR